MSAEMNELKIHIEREKAQNESCWKQRLKCEFVEMFPF